MKLDIVLNHALKMEDLNDRLARENDKLHEVIRENRSEIDALKREISFMTKKANRVHERVGVLKWLKPEQYLMFFRESMLMKKKPRKTRRYEYKLPPSFEKEWDEVRLLINPNARR